MTRAKWLFAVCALGALGAASGARRAQLQLPFSLPWSTGAVPAPAQAAPPPGSPPEWSGQPGSSGHPLMTTEAILTAARNFPSCIEGLWPDAAKRGVTRETFDTYTRGLTPDLRIMDLMDAQPEFTKAFWDYLDLLVSDNRIKRGREILAQYRPAFDAMEKAYGVDRHYVTAIWGIEFELRHLGRRTLGGALDRDARLRRPPPGLFPRRVSGRARDSQPRRHRSRQAQGVLGRRVRADPVHADLVQAIRGRFRRRRPPRRRRTRCRISSPRPPTT